MLGEFPEQFTSRILLGGVGLLLVATRAVLGLGVILTLCLTVPIRLVIPVDVECTGRELVVRT